MTKAALAKLFVVAILAFIICLPEFFITTRAVLQVKLHCHRYDPCEGLGRGGRVGEGRRESRLGEPCDSPLVPGGQGGMASQKPLCFVNNTNQSTVTSSDQADISWVMCDVEVVFLDLHDNASLSGESVEVWMEFEPLNITLYRQLTHGSILNTTTEDHREEEDTVQLLNCCLPALHAYKSTNHSKCLLQMTNQKILESQTQSATKSDGWCVYRVLYVALPCAILILVFTYIMSQKEWKSFCCHNKPSVFITRPYKARAPITDSTGLKMKMSNTVNGGLNCVSESHCPIRVVDKDYRSSYPALSPIRESAEE